MDTRWHILILAIFAFETIRGFKYTLYDSAEVSWHEAMEKCRRVDHILARLNTETAKIWVSTLRQYVKRSFWIGLSRQQEDGKFRWSDSSVLDYSNWGEGSPAKATTNDISCVRLHLKDFLWETDNCSLRLNYLCEDQYHTETYVTKRDKEIKGLLLGFCFLGCLVLVCCLLLQLPCCRLDQPSIMFRRGPGRAGQKGAKRNDHGLLI